MFVDAIADYRRSVLLAGEGRSGTTWVLNIVNHDGACRNMFEPFHPHFVELCQGFSFFQYIRPDNADERFLLPARLIVTGQYRHPRVDLYTAPAAYANRLIKDIFANLFLKWLTVHFPGLPIVLVVRHPCAVALSKMHMSHWIWGVNPKEFLNQAELLSDYLQPFQQAILGCHNVFEQHIFHWCITHFVPLQQLVQNDIHIIFYEHLCERREEEIRRLFTFIDRPFHKEAMRVSEQPSVTCRHESAIVTKSSLTQSWRTEISGQQLRRALDILKLFGLDQVYGEGPMPLVESGDAILPCCR